MHAIRYVKTPHAGSTCSQPDARTRPHDCGPPREIDVGVGVQRRVVFTTFVRRLFQCSIVIAGGSAASVSACAQNTFPPPMADAPGRVTGRRPTFEGAHDDMRDSLHPQHGNDTFDWGHFLTDVTKTGVQFTLPRFSSQSTGTSMWSGNAVGQTGGAVGMPNRPGANFSAAAAGASLLRSLADSAGGNLGSSLHVVSSFMNPSEGYAVPTNTGLDFRLSTSLGGAMNSFGGQAKGGRGQQGPSLSLKLKF